MRVFIFCVVVLLIALVINFSSNLMALVNIPSLLFVLLFWMGLNVLYLRVNPFKVSDLEVKQEVWKEQIKILYAAGGLGALIGVIIVLLNYQGITAQVGGFGVALTPLLYATVLAELVARPIVRNTLWTIVTKTEN